MDNGVSDATSAFFDGRLRSEPSLLSDDLDDPAETIVEGGLGFSGTEEVVREHRASVIADLAPAEAKAKEDEGGGWTLEADELGHESLGTVELLLEFLEAEVRRAENSTQESEACVLSDTSILPELRIGGLCRPDLFGSQ